VKSITWDEAVLAHHRSSIREKATREAFDELVAAAIATPAYFAEPVRYGRDKYVFTYVNPLSAEQPFSFIANKNAGLVFYVRPRGRLLVRGGLDALKRQFQGVWENPSGEWRIRLSTKGEADKLNVLLFGSSNTLELAENAPSSISQDPEFPNELDPTRQYVEGARRQVWVNAFERDPRGREACLRHYGFDCAVCAFNFEDRYGELGRDFIHVHHLKSMARTDGRYELDPINDLRPVCPNCHAMLHRGEEVLSIEELRGILKEGRT
jgi:HNH endonuclease